ncbi:hypothetical protein EIN_310080 [Entamoeba invadens IP1]|uniref:Uncharacterized protein n=1 Tax=Entamoeba invadens IP1 TaxID=370355 RepID=A0A0A1TZ24_ENTIV|nr:hypothetical protein EIN_310080 [Entamoeba invadens IP1]ELP84975.1 hypothetical protein EIN_310080 [Entamoeba invadens IP1]|eukprot:XP_004184321.1 hypothetical protein EIN_310080 [Entamoeba invadens IP1]
MSMDQVSNLLGKYLLQGWTMLQASCHVHPTVPLMRERGGKKCICVLCNDRYYIEDGESLLMYITKKEEKGEAKEQEEEKKQKPLESDDVKETSSEEEENKRIFECIQSKFAGVKQQPNKLIEEKEVQQNEENTSSKATQKTNQCKQHQINTQVTSVLNLKIKEVLEQLKNTPATKPKKIRKLADALASLQKCLEMN